MTEYSNHEKALVLDELAHELSDIKHLVHIRKAPDDDSWLIQINGTFAVSQFTADALRKLMDER